MTVEQLRQALANVPGDSPVNVTLAFSDGREAKDFRPGDSAFDNESGVFDLFIDITESI